MGSKNENLTEAEWRVMEYLWERSPLTGRELTDALEQEMGWNRSTTLTLLRRMESKGAVRSRTEDSRKVFLPAIAREDAALAETEDFLSRVYKGSISLMLSAMTKKQALSAEEIEALHAMLNAMEGGNGNA